MDEPLILQCRLLVYILQHWRSLNTAEYVGGSGAISLEATSAFGYAAQGIDGYYVEGVSLTHGQSGSRTHIWTFAAGLSEV